MSQIPDNQLVQQGASVRSHRDFIAFMESLLRSYRTRVAPWPNDSLERFLDALAGFVRDMEGYYRNRQIEVDLDIPGWRVLAEALLAARVYE
jgi:hypothetical protein